MGEVGDKACERIRRRSIQMHNAGVSAEEIKKCAREGFDESLRVLNFLGTPKHFEIRIRTEFIKELQKVEDFIDEICQTTI